jgi:hypothetical protein
MREWKSIRLVCGATVAVCALALAGCGGGSAGSSTVASTSSAGSTPSTTNKSGSVSLSGSPPTSVTVGQGYSFTPTVTASGGTVGFSIKNAPPWVAFNTSTGALTGTPQAGNAGTDSNIVITATDGSASASLGPFSIDVVAANAGSGSALISWTPPTTATDGSTLGSNLAGYEIFYGTSMRDLNEMVNVTNVGLTSYTISGLTSGTWYFVVTAYTADGTESEPSNVVTKTIA